MPSPKTKQKQSTRPQDKRPLFEENSVLSGLSASTIFIPLTSLCKFIPKSINHQVQKPCNPPVTGFPPGWACGSGSPPGDRIHFQTKYIICTWSLWSKDPELHVDLNPCREERIDFFFSLSNRKAYKSSSPLSNIQRQLIFTAKVTLLKLLRKRKEMDYRPPRKAAASRRSASLCYCLSVPCDPLEQSDTQNWFSPFSGLCFQDPRNINFHKLFWRTITQCRFNWNRQ